MPFVQIVVELLIGFVLLFLMTKLLGKTQIQQITPFDFISALVLGELLGNAIYDEEVGLTYIFFAVLVWGSLMYLVEFIEIKSLSLRGFLDGKPAILIAKGVMDRQTLGKNKISVDQLKNMLRQKDIFSVQEVEYAILETSGTLSVMKKEAYEAVQKRDLQLTPGPEASHAELPLTVILEGKAMTHDLHRRGYSEDWLLQKLKEKGYEGMQGIFFAEWTDEYGLYVVEQ
ncbi:DUF421 domain-containing protein [Marinicrinis sediminis]|uniref:DUF421 domain-containing protein n=1 Tax=Marinicrinis sediminis TaxID=1652465 RepID=A0ABW5RFK4_9BACL